jgi:hypothetical protein
MKICYNGQTGAEWKSESDKKFLFNPFFPRKIQAIEWVQQKAEEIINRINRGADNGVKRR